MQRRRDARHDVLFEPVRIGPHVARNRFYQVPHCSGMGYRDPSANAAMRGVKAEGGWAVVCTEQAEIHPSSEITPFIEARLWDDRDLPALARVVEAIHAHGALAGIELCYNGMNGPNFYSREVPLGPAHLPIATFTNDPVQARAMTREDIRNLRRWHRAAALRARQAGFDIVYVYAGHGLSGLQYFLSRRYNTRTDEYGGSIENRIRLLRELIEDTRAAIGDACAVPVRLSVDELRGPLGLHREEVHEMIALLAELPDAWDLVMGSWELDSRTSRFAPEASQEPFVRGVKALTTKPVIGVGRFTSPDTMVRMIREGLLDFIGAARPSIADPFLPRKIEDGRSDDIRECIGCNICVSGDMTMSPIRCTQNPTIGEEWRRGWHPERVAPRRTDVSVLVVGAGPAGLEAARTLGARGYRVTLAEAERELGGRVAREPRLPGLAAWGRVLDYRLQQLRRMKNVGIYPASRVAIDDVLQFGYAHVAIATGARWRRDGVARFHTLPIPIAAGSAVFTPDDVLDGRLPAGRVLVYDDDHYYMGGVLAEALVRAGSSVTFVTPSSMVSDWTAQTLEQQFIQQRLIELGVEIVTAQALSAVSRGSATTECVYTGRTASRAADAVLLVTARLPVDDLYLALSERSAEVEAAGVLSVRLIGDANAPGPIAWAVHAGHRYARELEDPEAQHPERLFPRELVALASPPTSS